MNKPNLKRKLLRGLMFAALGTVFCFTAHAVTTCSLSSSALTFPAYDPSSTSPTDGLGTVVVTCINNQPISVPSATRVQLRIGASANGTVTDRKMASNGDSLQYGICSDPGFNANWDNGLYAPSKSTGEMTLNVPKNVTFTLYGRIPPQQNIRAGFYSDSLLLTVTP